MEVGIMRRRLASRSFVDALRLNAPVVLRTPRDNRRGKESAADGASPVFELGWRYAVVQEWHVEGNRQWEVGCTKSRLLSRTP